MKIGFLAMSGIRAHDPELLKRGLTLPGFVERSKQVAALPSLGLLDLAAVTPRGHEMIYAEAQEDRSEPDFLYDCDLVAISTFSAQIFEAYSIADRLRAAGVMVAMGGLHVSVLPDEALAHADFVAVGEGEHVWRDIVAAAEHGERRKVFHASERGAVDLAQLATPRYDLLMQRPYNRFTVQTSRGCPHRCDFCASTVMLQQRYRKRPVEDVVSDILAIRRLRPNAFIEFADDNTFVDKQWGKALCRAIEPLGIKWFTETDITVADDPELLELIADSGCRQLLIGLESPEASALEGLELRSNFKAKSARRYAEAVRRIQAHGVTVNGCFILGLDSHDASVFERVLQFAEDAALFEVQVTMLTAFPGTPLYERLLAEKRVLQPGRWDLCTLFDVNHRPLRMTPDELRSGMYALSEQLYSAERMERRRARFFDEMRAKHRHRFAAPASLETPRAALSSRASRNTARTTSFSRRTRSVD
jgi:radical SAM superfamily enzyme YgiQ (UPF0313 family)